MACESQKASFIFFACFVTEAFFVCEDKGMPKPQRGDITQPGGDNPWDWAHIVFVVTL